MTHTRCNMSPTLHKLATRGNRVGSDGVHFIGPTPIIFENTAPHTTHHINSIQPSETRATILALSWTGPTIPGGFICLTKIEILSDGRAVSISLEGTFTFMLYAYVLGCVGIVPALASAVFIFRVTCPDPTPPIGPNSSRILSHVSPPGLK
jgi:hypothetical protein